ncbi:MAG: hypothetical protein Q9167_006389 [Letrouitia subvulpina]
MEESAAVIPTQARGGDGCMVWKGIQGRKSRSGPHVNSDQPVEPGGAIAPPTKSKVLLLDLRIKPRMSLYLEDEQKGSFVVDAELSYYFGEPYARAESSFDLNPGLISRDDQSVVQVGTDRLNVSVTRSDTGQIIIANVAISINSTGNEFPFDLTEFLARKGAFKITLSAKSTNGRAFIASTELRRLPNPGEGKSVTKIDNFYGGVLPRTNSPPWSPVFPYSFYLAGPGWVEDPEYLVKFKHNGFNIFHLVPGGGLGYNLTELDLRLDEAEKLGLWIMFDMRWSYQNEEWLTTLVNRVKGRKNLLLWYTGDEPDGHNDPPSAPRKAYELINSLDGYHPVSICLNCQNFYFGEYSSGADILLADVYPVGNDLTYSTVYHTPCTPHHGDCGCDNCTPSPPLFSTLQNIPNRLDLWRTFQRQVPFSPSKPVWSVPQGFPKQDFWQEDPKGDEWVAMTLLAVNHGAKGIVSWLWPSTQEIEEASGRLAAVILGIVGKFILGAEERKIVPVEGEVDAAGWMNANGEVLIVIIAYKDEGKVVLDLGLTVQGGVSGAWGSSGWGVEDNRRLVKDGVKETESWVLVLKVDKRCEEGATLPKHIVNEGPKKPRISMNQAPEATHRTKTNTVIVSGKFPSTNQSEFNRAA